ncbi:ATP-binding protein [Aquifex sp.]
MEKALYLCEKCKDTGFIKTEEGKVKLCECRFRERDVNKLLRIPRRFWNASFDNYVADTPSQATALMKAKRFAYTFDPEEGKGLTFIGSPGVGKTHLAVAILKAIYDKKRIRGIFFDTKDLIYRIKILMDERKDLKLINYIVNHPLLVLDDLGSERLSEWQRELISYIITQRYNNMKSTIITTNYKLEGEGNGKLGYDLSSRLGDNVISKIFEMTEVITISGSDRRKLVRI